MGRPRKLRVVPEAWENYAAGTKVEHFAWWSENELVQVIDQFAGKPLILEPWQLQIFSEALAVNADGTPYWSQIVVVLPRKNGKTTMVGAYGTYHCDQDDGQPEVLLTASSDKQAGRLFDTMTSFVRQSPYLSERFHIRDYIGELSRTDGLGKIMRMASDANRAHGYNPSLVIPDELHAWTTPTLKKAWAAFVTGGGARLATQVFAISTAGDAQDRESGILGQLIDGNERCNDVERPSDALTISRNHEARTLVFNYSAPTTSRSDVAAIMKANPASWITERYIGAQAVNPAVPDSEFMQLHGCVWAEAGDSWLPAETWDKCADPDRVVDSTVSVVLGFDGSATNDSTALIGCTIEDTPHLFVVGVWERPSTRHEWKVPRLEVERAVKNACATYDVVEFAADPPLWRTELETWELELRDITFVHYDTRQLATMGDACSRLYSAVVEQRVSHDGSPVLAQHIANCKGKNTRWGMVVTKPKGSPHKIDAAVAAIAAHDRAVSNAETSGPGYVRLYGDGGLVGSTS